MKRKKPVNSKKTSVLAVKPGHVVTLALLVAVVLLGLQLGKVSMQADKTAKQALLLQEKAKYLEYYVMNTDARTVLSDTAIKQKDWTQWNEFYSQTDRVLELYKRYLADLSANVNLPIDKLEKMRADFYMVNRAVFDELKTSPYFEEIK